MKALVSCTFAVLVRLYTDMTRVIDRTIGWSMMLLLFVLAGFNDVSAQPLNQNCLSAQHISNVNDYCSEPGEFTNIGANSLGEFMTPCLIDLNSDVWFSFVPTAPAAIIEVNGFVNNLGTLQGPGIFVFSGTCSDLDPVGCNTVSAQAGTVEVTVSDLVLGQVYYVAVTGVNPGTFQLCIDQFVPPPTPEQDCDKAVVLCDKSPFFVERLTGTGDALINEVSSTCIREESASVWYKWTCLESGSLTFALTPNNWVPGFESDDLDFVLYELLNGLDDCLPSSRRVLRCMASGANTGPGGVLPLSEWILCNGPTGLREGEVDTEEAPGCENGSNNWIAPAMLEEGKSYALVINNYSASGLGFSIEFGGTATFVGPEPDFEVDAVQAFECDKTIVFTNQSSSATDQIVSWEWNFGAGATPGNLSGQGPHDVIYESFGPKVAALTVTSSRGCEVTKIVDLFVDPCCADTSTLDIDALTIDESCPNINDGIIEAFGISGAPQYSFSIDGVNFQPSPVIPGLAPGSYEIFVQDIKGCVASVFAEILPAPPYSVTLGDTIMSELGQTVQLNAVPSPFKYTTLNWTPIEFLTFGTDSLSPSTIPPGTTTYEVQVTNEDGCIATDQIVVLVDIVRPVYAPNVFSPNGDGVNDMWFLNGGPAVARIEAMRVFDRWGGLVFEQTDVPIGESSVGWDGRINGVLVNPGVFAFHARVLFVDNVALDYSGSITVVR